jgi:NAD+ kinase
MKISIVSKNNDEIEILKKDKDFEIVEKNPDFVISYGGDGTLMKSEHKFPGVPKILLCDSGVCKKCSPYSNEEILEKIKNGKYVIEESWKLEAEANSKRIIAMNDIIVHNRDARHAIRYRLWNNDQEIGKEIIGDGVVIATPFGSTAYYRSITDSFFEVGIGIAFNNSTEQSDHMVVKEDGKIKIKITRGPALVYADNQEEFIELEKDDEVTIKKSNQIVKIVKMS